MNVAFASTEPNDDACGEGCITDGLYSDPDLLREAAKNGIFLVARPLRGGGGGFTI